MPADAPANNLFEAFFDLCLTGGVLYDPVRDTAGEVVDFAFSCLNPVAQRLLGLPRHPATTYRQQFPGSVTAGTWAFHRDAFLADAPRELRQRYQADGYDSYYVLAARRVGQQLLVSFTATASDDDYRAEPAIGPAAHPSAPPHTAPQPLSPELEARVQEHAHAAHPAHTDTGRERELLQTLLAQAPVAIALFQGEELRVTAVNSLMAALWGRLPEQVRGLPLLEGVPELRGQGFGELLRQVLATQVPYTGTEMPATLLRNGELKTAYFNFVYQPLYDAAGEVLGIIDVAVEVTEQVEARRRIEQLVQQARAASAEAERQRGELQRVFELAPVAIAVYRGPAFVVELANAMTTRIWDRTREQLLGQPLFEAIPEAAGQGFEELLRQVLTTGRPVEAHAYEARLQRAGHLETMFWDFVYMPLTEADGRVTGVLAVATDVTAQVLARRQAEQLNQELETRVQQRTRQLTEQQTLLRQILGNVPAAIATLSGPEHRFTFFNELYQTLAVGRAELSYALADVFPELPEQGFVRLLDQAYATGEPFAGTEMPVQLRQVDSEQLQTYYFDFIYQPLFDAQHQVQGILVFALDVTDRAQARQQVEATQLQVLGLNEELAAINEELRATNEELHESNTRLTRTNVDLDTFVYTASHDLKAPITNIEGILLALRETLPATVQADEVVAHIMRLLDNTVSRFQTTIDQLTDLSRLQRSYDAPAELLQLAPVVADVLADLAPAIAAALAQVEVTVPPQLCVSFAPASLRSIVYNLLSNAVKYRDAERPAQVWLRAEQRPGAVVLEVRDNGLGLSESQQGRLFGVFQRLHTHVAGTGVGLYMIKRLIDNAGASIAVSSTPGIGSTFTVTFPI